MLTEAQYAELAAAAHRGGLLQDVANPGWASRVDPDMLNMHSTQHCVLGQSMNPQRVSGNCSYVSKLGRLGLDVYSQIQYGFALMGFDNTSEHWDALTDAWRHEIAVRVAPTTPAQVDQQEPLALVA